MSGPLVVLITIILIIGAALLAAVESAIAVLSRADVVDAHDRGPGHLHLLRPHG